MNQGKLEVVKQEKARVNIDILGISELKWIGMGEFNLDSSSCQMQCLSALDVSSEKAGACSPAFFSPENGGHPVNTRWQW